MSRQDGMRGAGVNLPADPTKVGMPARPFLYTIDQIAALLSLDEATVRRTYLFYDGRSTGVMARDLLVARNIAPRDSRPEWRVAERELIRWLKFKRFRVYESGAVSH